MGCGLYISVLFALMQSCCHIASKSKCPTLYIYIRDVHGSGRPAGPVGSRLRVGSTGRVGSKILQFFVTGKHIRWWWSKFVHVKSPRNVQFPMSNSAIRPSPILFNFRHHQELAGSVTENQPVDIFDLCVYRYAPTEHLPASTYYAVMLTRTWDLRPRSWSRPSSIKAKVKDLGSKAKAKDEDSICQGQWQERNNDHRMWWQWWKRYFSNKKIVILTDNPSSNSP